MSRFNSCEVRMEEMRRSRQEASPEPKPWPEFLEVSFWMISGFFYSKDSLAISKGPYFLEFPTVGKNKKILRIFVRFYLARILVLF